MTSSHSSAGDGQGIAGSYRCGDIDPALWLSRVNAPTSKELNALVATISERVARYLEREGGLARGEQSDHLTLALDDEEGTTMQQLLRPLDNVSDSFGTADRRKVLKYAVKFDESTKELNGFRRWNGAAAFR